MKNRIADIQRIFTKYILLVLLLISSAICSFFIILLTPLCFYRKFGIFFLEAVAEIIWSIFHFMFITTYKFEIENEQVLNDLEDESIVVTMNHLGAIDFILVNLISRKKNMLRFSKYMIKDSIKYVPILGNIKFLGYILLKRNYKQDEQIIKDWLKYFLEHKNKFWLIIYPEGTRFTKEKQRRSIEFGKTKGFKPMDNLLYPRSKGFKLCVENLKNTEVKFLLDITIYYQSYDSKHDDYPTLFEFLFLMPKGKFIINLKVTELKEIVDPSNFLLEEFYLKDQLINKWKKRKIE